MIRSDQFYHHHVRKENLEKKLGKKLQLHINNHTYMIFMKKQVVSFPLQLLMILGVYFYNCSNV